VFSSPEAAEHAFDVMGDRAQADSRGVDLVYSRFNHPNAEIVEDHLVPLEPEAVAAAVFNSGMAAIMTATLAVLKPGDTVIYTTPIYGATHVLVSDFFGTLGIRSIAIDAGRGDELDAAIRSAKNLRLVLIESPANPNIVMTDIRRACETVAQMASTAMSNGREPSEGRPVVMVDNTFMGPAFQHPLALGADASLYSATKYLGGYSDIIGGVALTKDVDLMKRIRAKRSLFGNILQPDECWILDTRLSTVDLRMNQQSKNAQHIAEALNGHPKISKVYYPTLFEDADQRRIYETQCDFPGGIVSINLSGGKRAAFDFLRRLEVARNAVSLGGVETLACHPRSTTHSAWAAADLDAAGICEGLVRISVGIENWRDLLHDFEQALEHA
jgi:methionine-gamma-lyase